MQLKKIVLAVLCTFYVGPKSGGIGLDQQGQGKNAMPLQYVKYPQNLQTGATLTLDESYSGGLVILDRAAGVTVTLPTATGSGAVYRFFNKTALSAASHIIKVGNTTDSMLGIISTGKSATAALPFAAAANDDTITLNATTTGGVGAGDYIEIEDVASGLFAVRGTAFGSGTIATPFSATV